MAHRALTERGPLGMVLLSLSERLMRILRSIVEPTADFVQLSSSPGAQPIQSGAPCRHEARLQAETLCCLGRVARSRGIDASARCSVSNRPDQLNASCPFTPPSKILSTSSAISHPAARSASSEKKLSRRGELLPQPELELGRADFPRPIQVHVTEPSRLMRERG